MDFLPTTPGLSLEDMLEFLDVSILFRGSIVLVELEYFDPEVPEFADLYVAQFDLKEFTPLQTYMDIITAAIKRSVPQDINDQNNDEYEEFI